LSNNNIPTIITGIFMDKTIIAALISVIGTLCGVLIGSIISRRTSSETIKVSHQNTIDLIQRQAFNKAATEFKNIFLPETTFLKHEANIGGLGSGNKLHEVLRSGYLRQLKAIEIFKDHLSVTDRESIHNAWDEYCHPKGIPQNKNEKRDFRFNDYSAIEDKQGIEEAKKVAFQHIEGILNFAKHK
jgi:hypothetical protein